MNRSCLKIVTLSLPGRGLSLTDQVSSLRSSKFLMVLPVQQKWRENSLLLFIRLDHPLNYSKFPVMVLIMGVVPSTELLWQLFAGTPLYSYTHSNKANINILYKHFQILTSLIAIIYGYIQALCISHYSFAYNIVIWSHVLKAPLTIDDIKTKI